MKLVSLSGSIQTRLESYLSLQKDLNARQHLVYELVRNHPYRTALEYARILGKDANFVRPRLSELKKSGRIIVDGVKKCPISKKSAEYYRVV